MKDNSESESSERQPITAETFASLPQEQSGYSYNGWVAHFQALGGETQQVDAENKDYLGQQYARLYLNINAEDEQTAQKMLEGTGWSDPEAIRGASAEQLQTVIDNTGKALYDRAPGAREAANTAMEQAGSANMDDWFSLALTRYEAAQGADKVSSDLSRFINQPTQAEQDADRQNDSDNTEEGSESSNDVSFRLDLPVDVPASTPTPRTVTFEPEPNTGQENQTDHRDDERRDGGDRSIFDEDFSPITGTNPNIGR